MDDTRLCQGISELCDSYTGYIIDQWGVLHDGRRPYDGAIEALKELKSRKKQVVILSNSGKRAEDNIRRLGNLGFDPSLFDHVLTSGEITWMGLKERKIGAFEGLGDACYLISRGGDATLVDGLGLTLVDRPEDASFILVSGMDDPGTPGARTVADLEPVLRVGVQRRLRMICANPDLQALIGASTHAGAGALAMRYEEFGGVVRYIGKPFPPAFRHAQSLFHDVLPSTTVVIGDSLPMDIMGGINCGLDTCLVATGVHGASFRGVKSRDDCHKVLRALGTNFGARPNFWIPKFHWGKVLLDRKNKRRQKRD
ncbi:MAG: TIGR01459 family HAD-type hydrolase [Rhodospirillales bacterium]|nr:TIGR01459 family HAD-type hydrolase [Alphaproteobacteria bacterium]MCB9987432.1 TIGR01459 family HAD-type hydrolase [Rhodospirillales bacterium]USO07586.1 MAG: TIGR01459 family HAD-type hydrolase [Rhodospirillales bacterium]